MQSPSQQLGKHNVFHDLAILAHFATLLGAVAAAVEVVRASSVAEAAAQAALAALACCYVVIPYCFARALGEIARHKNNT